MPAVVQHGDFVVGYHVRIMGINATMKNALLSFINFIRFIATRFNQDRCVQIAASLTFTTLLSLVPLITIALAMFSAFPVFEDFSNQIKVYLLNNLMPDMAGKIIPRRFSHTPFWNGV